MNSEVRITTTGLEKEKDKRSMLQAGDWFDFKIVVDEETRYLYELLFYSGLPCLWQAVANKSPVIVVIFRRHLSGAWSFRRRQWSRLCSHLQWAPPQIWSCCCNSSVYSIKKLYDEVYWRVHWERLRSTVLGPVWWTRCHSCTFSCSAFHGSLVRRWCLGFRRIFISSRGFSPVGGLYPIYMPVPPCSVDIFVVCRPCIRGHFLSMDKGDVVTFESFKAMKP